MRRTIEPRVRISILVRRNAGLWQPHGFAQLAQRNEYQRTQQRRYAAGFRRAAGHAAAATGKLSPAKPMSTPPARTAPRPAGQRAGATGRQTRCRRRASVLWPARSPGCRAKGPQRRTHQRHGHGHGRWQTRRPARRPTLTAVARPTPPCRPGRWPTTRCRCRWPAAATTARPGKPPKAITSGNTMGHSTQIVGRPAGQAGGRAGRAARPSREATNKRSFKRFTFVRSLDLSIIGPTRPRSRPHAAKTSTQPPRPSHKAPRCAPHPAAAAWPARVTAPRLPGR